MKALIVRSPWIKAILRGEKTWEMRTAPTMYRGPLALIEKGTGLIVGVTRLLDSLPRLGPDRMAATREWHRIPAELDETVIASGWMHPWVLGSTFPLASPVTAGQRRGQVVWVGLDEGTIASVWSGLSTFARGRLLEVGRPT